VSSGVFSGAGLSAAPPASLPLGYALRDAVLELMFEQAARYAPEIVNGGQLRQLSGPERKLEQVLGRLWRIVGHQALECLRCLRVGLPNEAHMLAALHLARGGVHVTVNFDRGIEQAYELMMPGAELPVELHKDYGEVLEQWQASATGAKPLRVVAAREQFEDWVADGRPPGLLKVHGSLGGDGGLIDVVVEDTEELGGLAPSRLAAVELLAGMRPLLITGYGGMDPDVYGPLLAAAESTDAVWATKSMTADSPVPTDLAARRIAMLVGDPQGLASTALRELLNERALSWPERELDEPGWRPRFTTWASEIVRGHAAVEFALAWAWLLADSGARDTAARLLRYVLKRDPSDVARLRLADVLYDRGLGSDRRAALRLYAGLASAASLDWSTRAHCLLRIGGVARGQAIRAASWRTPLYFIAALAAPCIVLAEQRRRGADADSETTAAAIGVIGQTVLRGCEQAAVVAPKRAWPLVARALKWAAARCEEASHLARNGNRRALATSHQLLALALSTALEHRQPDPNWTSRLESLATTYINAGDFPGAGNCCAALAVLALADDDLDCAEMRLRRAADYYAEGRADQSLISSGASLLERLQALRDRIAEN